MIWILVMVICFVALRHHHQLLTYSYSRPPSAFSSCNGENLCVCGGYALHSTNGRVMISRISVYYSLWPELWFLMWESAEVFFQWNRECRCSCHDKADVSWNIYNAHLNYWLKSMRFFHFSVSNELFHQDQMPMATTQISLSFHENEFEKWMRNSVKTIAINYSSQFLIEHYPSFFHTFLQVFDGVCHIQLWLSSILISHDACWCDNLGVCYENFPVSFQW